MNEKQKQIRPRIERMAKRQARWTYILYIFTVHKEESNSGRKGLVQFGY